MKSTYEIKVTQLMLNRLGHKIKSDGIIGKKETIPALTTLASKVKSVMQKKGFEITDRYNLVGLRLVELYDNIFSDVYAFIDFESPEKTRLFPFSSRPGVYGKGTVTDPKWHGGVFGVAVLKEGQYKDAYSQQGPWWSGLPFLYQVKHVTVWRDGNKDLKLDKVNAQTGLFGINHHSWNGHNSQYVNRLSIGCQVFQQRYSRLITKLWTKLTEQNKFITYTLLEWNK